MPLTMANTGEANAIKKIGGKEETKKFLESLGFVVGGNVILLFLGFMFMLLRPAGENSYGRKAVSSIL